MPIDFENAVTCLGVNASDVKSWFTGLSLHTKKKVFSYYTEDEHGRTCPVHHDITEENCYRILKDCKSDGERSEKLDSVFCSLDKKDLFEIYYDLVIHDRLVDPVHPSHLMNL